MPLPSSATSPSTPRPRDTGLDMLRGFGMVLLVLAHSSPPAWLFQLRNFDVPLLVAVSAATYATIYQNRVPAFFPFIRKRLSRIVFPAWIFLSVFFALAAIAAAFSQRAYPFAGKQIASSYAFAVGIGYVWVLKVFAFTALMTPWMLGLKRKIPSQSRYLRLLFLLYVLYELAVAHVHASIPSGAALNVFDRYVFIFIPYALLFAYALQLPSMTTKQILRVAMSNGMIFIGLAILFYTREGAFIQTQAFKQPPQLYYLSYGMMSLNLAYAFTRTRLVERVPQHFLSWLSLHSLWVYLWHIFAIYLWLFLMGREEPEGGMFVAKFFFVLALACTLTHFQASIVSRLAARTENPRMKAFFSLLT